LPGCAKIQDVETKKNWAYKYMIIHTYNTYIYIYINMWHILYIYVIVTKIITKTLIVVIINVMMMTTTIAIIVMIATVIIIYNDCM